MVTLSSEAILSSEIQGIRVAGTVDAASLEDFFHIGSCGKSVLAMLAGRLIDQGKLEWSSRLFDILPDLGEGSDPAYVDVSLEDLFLCRAGIAPYTSGEEQFPEIDPSAANPRLEFARYLVSQPPCAEPDAGGGFKHVYSNASYTMASLMLERASGQNWESLVAALADDLRISIRFGWPNETGESQPWGHGLGDDGKQRPFPPGDPYRLSPLIAPAGDLSMPPVDYARYVQLQLQGLLGRDNYLRSSTYRHIHLGHRGFSIGVGNGKYYGKLVSQFDGSAGTFYCHSIIVHDANFAYVVLANTGTPKAVAEIYKLSVQIAKQHFRWWWKLWL